MYRAPRADAHLTVTASTAGNVRPTYRPRTTTPSQMRATNRRRPTAATPQRCDRCSQHVQKRRPDPAAAGRHARPSASRAKRKATSLKTAPRKRPRQEDARSATNSLSTSTGPKRRRNSRQTLRRRRLRIRQRLRQRQQQLRRHQATDTVPTASSEATAKRTSTGDSCCRVQTTENPTRPITPPRKVVLRDQTTAPNEIRTIREKLIASISSTFAISVTARNLPPEAQNVLRARATTR